MSRNDDFNHTLESWLRHGAASQAPDRVLDAALERVRTLSQRRGWLQSVVGGGGTASLTRVVALAVVVAIVLFASLQLGGLLPDVGEPSSAPTGSASPSGLPSSSQAASGSPSAVTLPSLSPALGCLDSPPDVNVLYDQTDPAACFGNAPLTFDGILSAAGVVDCPGSHEPAWIYCPADGNVQALGETRKVGAPFLLVAVDPTGGVSLSQYSLGTNVRITGHFDDPAAQTCREVEPIPGESPRPASEMIQVCRQTFVVTQVVPLGP
jgi:hypothetical protein